MAIEEKLLKSLEFLKNTDYTSGDVFHRNRDKMQNCAFIVDTLTSHTAKVLPNFQHLLSTTFETLFLLCNDNESDLRLTAEESLNKIIKATDGENMNRVLMELHKELKKNGPVRSLRAALLRFSNMAHLIRLPKRKQYLISIMPCIVSISERQDDDLLHESLMKCLPKILKSLGNFLSETDVKTLLNTFLSNIGNSSPIIRRANANCLVAVCLNCRKPYQLLSHLLDTLLDLIITAPDKIQDVSVFTVLGVLNCLKLHLPYMMKKTENIQQEIQGSFGITKKTNIMQVDNDKVIQVYQMCLHFLLCHDDSVMSAALDTLNTFLQNCTPEIKSILLSSDGIKSGRLSFPSHFLLIKSVSKSQKIESQSSSTTTEENFERTCETRTFTRDNHSTNLDGCLRCRTGASDELCSVQANYADIGSFNDKNVSLLYCVRLVCKSCILAGRPNNIIPDAVVRITLKNLAMTCLSSIFSMYPSSFLLYLLLLEKNNSSESISGDDGSHRDDGNNNRQPISDIMLLADHSDPQLRGAVRHAVASYLKSALAESNGCYEEWCLNNTLAEGRTSRSDIYALKNIITFIKEGLLDESSNCVRQVLSSVTICLQAIVFDSSNPRNNALPLLELLPALSKHSHWLIKVKLLDVIVKLPFLSIESIAGDVGYQNKIVFDVVFLLLTDEDRRVRTAAIDTLIRIIPSLYTERRRKPIEREAVERIRMYFRNQSLNTCFEQQQQQQDNDDEQTGISSELNDSDMPFPFDVLLSEIAYRRKEEDEGECYTGTVVDTLSIVISSLYRRLKENSTDNTIIIIGHIEALDRLSVAYPTTVFGEVWDIDEMSSSSSNLERFVRSVLFENELVYDIHFHIHVLRLYGNLLAGAYIKNLYDIIETTNIATKRTTITAACESFLSHMMKLLNMFVHLVQNTSPPIAAELKAISTNSVTQTQPGSSSPLKAVIRKSSDVVVASIGDRRTDDDEKSSSTSATEKKHHESTKAATAMALGYFSNSVHYMKIYSRLKISFAKYKTTLNYDDDDDNEPEDIIAFLRTLLTCFGQILEITGVTETSKIAEEILSYMQTIFHLEPTCTITCVHQLLKSLFGSNLVESHRSDIIRTTIKQQKQRQNENQRNADRQDDNDDDDSDPDTLYYVLSRFHYENILNHFELIRSKWFSTIGNETYYDSGASSKLTTTPSSSPSFRKREKRQIGPNKSTDKMLANYIRLFESMVIGSLKHYTITSDVQVQCAVLRLLNQLVRLKVNYCLLDSEQVFIKFIQKQFEYIEDGLVMNPEKLIPNMFDFLTSLSHGKQHSKSIIGVPKIIQLCDGLMASEQSPSTCCIPALKPIVEDVFLTRCSVAGNNATATTTGELDELEIAREVLLSMLLRLFEYAEVLDLLRIILLNEARRKTAADRWYKWSMQMWDVFVAKLTDCKLKLDNSKDMLAILRWLVALHPGLFRRSLSINELLAILFRRFPIKEKNIIMISRWLGKIIVIMTIVVQLSEAELLKATRESLSNFSPEGTFDCISDRIIKSDPLNVTKVENDLQGFNVESVFAKFIFRVLEIASAQCALAARQSQDTHFLVEQLSHLLFICCEIYQSDNYPILLGTSIDLIAAAAHRDSTTTTVSPYRDMLETIDGHIFNLGKKCPILIYQWCAIRNMLKIEKSATTVSVNSTKSYFIRSVANTKEQLYLTLTTSALLFSYSEYLIEEAAYKETLSEFIQVNVFFIVWYCEEPPITELISIIHRDITTSRILIEHISNMIIRQSNILEPHFIIRLLNVLQNCHESHTGSLIMLLTIDVIRRCCRHLAVLRMVVNVTCRKLEYLLTLHVDEIRRQMSESDLNRIVHHIVETKLASMKKNKTILGLLSKLSVQIYATNQQQQSIVKLNVLNAPVTTGFGYVRDMKIDKRWYLDWLTEKKNRILCICSTDDEGETNEALCQMINVEDVAEINEKKDDQEIKTIFLTNVLKVFATNMVNRGGDVDGSRTSQNKRDRKKNPLLQMSIHTVFNDIAMFLKKYREKYRRHRHSRRQHQIQDFEDRRMTTSSEEYSRQNVTLLEEQEEESGNVRRRNLIEIVKIVTTSFAIINRQICDDDDDESTLSLNRSLLVSFCVVCLESIASTVRAGGSINVDYVSNVLECTERMLRVPQLTFVLTLRSHLSWLCSIVDSLHRLLVHFCPSPDDYGNDTDDDEAIITAKRATISNVGGGGRGRRQWTMEKKIQRANRQLEAAFIMVTSKNAAASARRTTLPRYLYSNVKSIVIRISTMSPFKSYLLTPTNLWKGIVRPAVVCATATVTNEQDDDDDAVDGTASNQTITEELLPPPPLPVDFLKDYDILSEYNFRITQLGWTDRKDFEETWMSLLSILNSDLIEDRSGSSSFSSSSTCFVIKVVTALLGRTLMSDTTTRALINTSCINESATFFHVPRDLPIWPSNEEVSLTKLKCVQDKLELLLKKKKNKMGGGNYGNSLLAATNVNVVTNVFNKSNVEKLVHDDSLPSSYYCGQISVAYLLLTLRKGTVDGEGEEEDVIDDDDEEENYPLMKLYNGRRAKEAHLDINSCIQSLLDIYTQWLQDSNKVKNVPVTLRTDGNDGGGGGCSCSILNEVLKSILVVSDLFHHRSQFCWMLDTLVELVKTHTHHQQHQQQQQQHSVMEDDIISNRYLIVGICKAVAVLNPDMEIYELIKRILNHNLIKRSSASSISVRLSCFYGLLYMLEGCVLNNTVIGGLTEELQFVLSVAIQHIDYYNNSINKKDGKHRYDDDEECLEITVWALKFYIIENIHDNQLPTGFVNTTIQSLLPDLKVVGIVGGTSTRTTTTTPVNYTLHSSLMKAMERLVLKRRLPTNLREQTLNLALHNIKNGNTLQSFLAIQLMITCMYIGDDDDERKGEELSRTTSLRIKDRRTSPLSSSSLIESDDVVMTKNPDHLMRTIEKVSVIFERIRRGLPLQDVEILSRILPHIIEDFFSPADILTKIVGEFLSPQQKYPALLSRVLFVVFGKGIERSQLPLLQDWVVISLSNFTQTLSTGTAVWYLTCFFISTSENFWLRSVFAYVRSRFGGRLEMEDREMLCIAGRDFYNRLASDRQRRIFIDTFKKAAEDDRRPSEESVPFRDLLDVCSSSP